MVSVGQKQPFLVSSRRLYCYIRRGRLGGEHTLNIIDQNKLANTLAPRAMVRPNMSQNRKSMQQTNRLDAPPYSLAFRLFPDRDDKLHFTTTPY